MAEGAESSRSRSGRAASRTHRRMSVSSRTDGLAPAAARSRSASSTAHARTYRSSWSASSSAAGDHQLALAELQLRRPLSSHPVPLPASLRAELARPAAPARVGEHPPAPPTAPLSPHRSPVSSFVMTKSCHPTVLSAPDCRVASFGADSSGLSGDDVVEAQFGFVGLDPLQPVAALEQRHQLAVTALQDPDPADLAEPIGRSWRR